MGGTTAPVRPCLIIRVVCGNYDDGADGDAGGNGDGGGDDCDGDCGDDDND